MPVTGSLEITDECWSFSIKVLTTLRIAWLAEVNSPQEISVGDQAMGHFQNEMFGDFWMSDMFNASWE